MRSILKYGKGRIIQNLHISQSVTLFLNEVEELRGEKNRRSILEELVCSGPQLEIGAKWIVG